MACMCCNYKRVIVGKIEIGTGNAFILGTPNQTVTASDKDRIGLVFTTGVPSGGEGLPLFVTVNGASVPVYDKYGNKIFGACIKTRKLLHAYFGTNGAAGEHIQLTQFPYCEC